MKESSINQSLQDVPAKNSPSLRRCDIRSHVSISLTRSKVFSSSSVKERKPMRSSKQRNYEPFKRVNKLRRLCPSNANMRRWLSEKRNTSWSSRL